MEPISSFGYWLRRRRKALDLTQDELARQVGCAIGTLKKIETDERRPSKQLAERLAACLEIPNTERANFLKAARAELAVDRLATPPPLVSAPARTPIEQQPRQQALKGYELREQIGSGGFGVVYRAEQPGVGRTVAIKIIVPEYANHPEFIRRFEAEARLVGRLEHPHIVPLYDYWREPGGAYLVMRYMRGGSLQAALAGGPWPLEQAAQLLDQIGAALAFAHRQSVVHRDIKPANVLLDEEGNAYLADFGIAKDLRMANELGQTQPGALVGSPEYLAPEQLKDEPVTQQTDIYSLGVLLYELLTGVHPFADLAPAARLYQQIHAPLPPIQLRRPDLPAAVNDIIQRATAKPPADRYPDVVSMVADWQRSIVSSPLSAVSRQPMMDEERGTTDHGQPTAESITLTDLAVITNPYKGLRAFGEADAADFFGREALTQRLLERLAEDEETSDGWRVTGDERTTRHPTPDTRHASRFLAVVGPSGSGKSSVVRAGLIPALRRGGILGSDRWFVAELLPRAHPLEELEAALLRVAVNPPPSLLEQLQADTRGLARATKRVLPSDPDAELVLVIDQFEELFTLTTDETVRAHVLDSLRAAVLDPHSRVRVIVTLRADFIDRPLLYAGFGKFVQQRTEFVLPLAPAELEQAIVGPAKRAGLVLEPGLVAAIVRDVGEQPGALPLLQYALTELFERRQGQLLTLAAYRESGGVRGALARRAEAIYAGLDESSQAAARQLFLRLITLGEGVEDTRRRAPRSELTALTKDQRPTTNDQGSINDTNTDLLSFVVGSSSAMDKVLDRYGRARLLTFDRDPITREPTVEVAHEALLREWGRLRAWLVESRVDIRMQRLLAAAAAEWNTAGRDPSYLLSGARLAQFEDWAAQTMLALTQDEHAFLETSLAERERQAAAERERQQRELATAQQLAATEQRRAEEQRRAATRLRRRAVYLVGALVLAVLAALIAGFFASSNATLATQNAASAATAQVSFVQAERLRLAAEANAALGPDVSGELPALLALHSLRYGYSPQADAALLNALVHGFIVQQFTSPASANISDNLLAGVTYGVAFSPDGKYILTGSSLSGGTYAAGTARLWDVATGRQLRAFTGHTNVIRSVAFSPDSSYALTSSMDGTTRLWNVQTGQEVRQFKDRKSLSLGGATFSPDGKYVVAGSEDGITRLWDLDTGQELRQFSGHTSSVLDVAFAPDGKSVLTGDSDEIARLWDVTTGQELRQFSGHAVAFAPDGKSVLTGSADKSARLWDAATGKLLQFFGGHTGGLNDVAFSPDGKYVLTGSDDRTARLWDVSTGRQLRVLSGHDNAVVGVGFSPDDEYILTSDDQTARLWVARAGLEPLTLSSNTNAVQSIAFSSDAKRILTGSAQALAELWDAQTGERLRSFDGDPGAVTSVAFSPDGRRALTIGGGKPALLWDVTTGERLRAISGSTGYGAAAFSPDGRYLLTSGDDKTARLWDAATGQELRQFSGHAEPVAAVTFSPDGKTVLTGSADKTARLWDAATGQELRAFNGHTAAVTAVAFAPDGKSVLTGSADKTARLWDAATGREMRIFTGHGERVTAVAFAPDGKTVLTGSADKTARLWDAATGQELRRYTGHTDAVTAVAFAPDGKIILTGSADKTARLWRTDVQDVVRLACSLLRRDLTAEERAAHNIADDAPTCPKT